MKNSRNNWHKKRVSNEKGGSGVKDAGKKQGVSKVVMLTNAVKEEDKVREMSDERIDLGNGWVSYLSKPDNYLDGVLSLLENSGTLSAVIEQMKVLVLSGGLIVMRGRGGVLGFFDRVKEFVSVKDKGVEELNDFLNDVNDDEEDILEVLEKSVDNYFSLGNGFIELVRGDSEGDKERNGERYFSVNHWDTTKCRIKKEKIDSDGVVSSDRQVGISEVWNKDKDGKKATVVSLYPNWSKMADGTERSVIQVKKYMRGFKYWGVPEWLAVKKWVELEYRVAVHNVSKFVNGYMPSAIIQFFGAKSKAEAEKVVKDLKSNFTDTGNNSKMFVQVVSDEKYKANVQILEDKNDGSFMELTRLSVQRIVTGLRWAMSVAGVETGGKLGGNQQAQKEYERINNMVIMPVRELYLKKVLKPVIEEAAEWMKKPEWKDLKLKFGNNSIFSLIEEVDVNSVLTINERRDILGVAKMDKEGMSEFMNEKVKIKDLGTNKKK